MRKVTVFNRTKGVPLEKKRPYLGQALALSRVEGERLALQKKIDGL